MKDSIKLLIGIIMLTIIVSGCKKDSDNTSNSGGNGGNTISDVKVTTYSPQNISNTSALCGGDVIVVQGLSLTELGVCWNTEGNPEASDNHVSTEVWNEPFVCTITGLVGNTTYHVRAYALDEAQCYYGEEKVFATEQICDELVYNDDNPIHLVLREEHKIVDSSAYPITYTSSDNTYVTVSDDGVLNGRNVGSAQVTLDNGFHSLTVDVIVDLFREPTFEFGCYTNRIRELYGNPYMSGYINDTILVYQYTGPSGYSYACGEMDFIFEDAGYCEADVYIRSSVGLLLNRYLDERFTLETIIGDTLYLYRFKLDNNIVCGKFDSHNQWNEICLYYFRADDIKSLNAALNKPKNFNIRRKD